MIEYDKANVTSSYPSLTEYEVATILDKAYLALIARKLTGNNTRRVPFEYDTKAIEDLRPLVVSNTAASTTATTMADNELAFKLPTDMLYYLEGQASYNDVQNPADEKSHSNEIITLVDHRTAQKFRSTNTNMPWIKQPVSFLQDDDVYVLYDTYKHRNPFNMLVTYIKKPASFVANLGSSGSQGSGSGGSGDNPGSDEPTQPTGQLSISIHRNDFQDDTKALIVATIVVENIEDQLYVDIFEKAETSSEWTLLNTDTYDNNHTISWPVDIATYNKNVKFVIRNLNSTIKKESNVFTISSKSQTEATGNISRIQYNSTDSNIEALCQLYNTSGIVLKYYIKPISASDQAYVLYGSDEENFTTITPYKEVWKYKKAEPGFVYKVQLIDKITDSVLDTKTIVVPAESSDWKIKEVYKGNWGTFLLTNSYDLFSVTWENKNTGATCKSITVIPELSNVEITDNSIKILDNLTSNKKVTIRSTCIEDPTMVYTETVDVFPRNLFYRTITIKAISADGFSEASSAYNDLGFMDGDHFINCSVNLYKQVKEGNYWKTLITGTLSTGNLEVATPAYSEYVRYIVAPGSIRKDGSSGEYNIIGWSDNVSEVTKYSNMSRIFPGNTTDNSSEFNIVIKKIV